MSHTLRSIPALILALALLASSAWATTVILNSQDYTDVVMASVFARAHNHTFVFALSPNQSVFLAKYYSQVKGDPIIYLEGQRTVLPNMGALLREGSGGNVEAAAAPLEPWIADHMGREVALLVGSAYGQDALAVSPYAALMDAPIYFIDEPSDAESTLSAVVSRGYKRVIVYGALGHQIPTAQLDRLPNKDVIDTGSRYSNNLKLVDEFLKVRPATQALFVSGKTFEKSMVDSQFPILLVGRSQVPASLSSFINSHGLKTGVVFSGDADIVDGVNRLRALNPAMTFFIKFGEGFRGVAQPLPLAVIPLPSPVVALEVLNLSYNVMAKGYELRVANRGDFVSLIAGVSVPGVGSKESSQISMDPGATTSLSIPLDSTAALREGRIPEATVSLQYGEDFQLLDNADTVTFTDVPTTSYQDTSSVRLVSIVYSPEQKAFIVNLDGEGWAEGTIRFSINNQPVVLRFASTSVSGPTAVRIKQFLSDDEARYVDGLPMDYFVRSGSRSDILLKESRGQTAVSLSKPLPGGSGSPDAPEPSTSAGGSGGFPWAMVLGALVLVVVVALFLRGRMAEGGESGF